MTQLGLICPPMHGHMHPMFSLGRELLRRGHQVTAFSLPEAERHARSAGLQFVPLGEDEFPLGSLKGNLNRLARMSGVSAVRFTIQMLRRESQVHLRDLPSLLKQHGVQAMLVDQVSPAAGSVCDAGNVPFFTICNALMLDQEPGIPPAPMHWSYSTRWWSRIRNRLGFALLQQLTSGIRKDVNAFRMLHGLTPHRRPEDWPSKLATIAQVPQEFDFPRQNLSSTFHYAGPFQDSKARPAIEFPWNQLDGRPLIYASMGTLQNGVARIFRQIAEACADSRWQLVIALGGGDAVSLGTLPGNPIVRTYAPQLELLQKASLTITHAGLNTVMESLAAGVPLVAIPITNDQPGAAARLEWIGAGIRIVPGRLSVDRLKSAIESVMSTPSYRANAVLQGQAIARSGGVRHAADVIETACQTQRPVFRRCA